MSKADDGCLNDKTMARDFFKGKRIKTYCRWCETEFLHYAKDKRQWFVCSVCDTVPNILEGVPDVSAT